jgi:predicted TIM-barrel fold metal-dependent hydrolase
MNIDPTPEAPACPGYDPAPRVPGRPLPARACDTHFHIFGPLDRYPYKAERSYTPPEAPEEAFRHNLHTLGLQRAVYVQPSVYGTDNSRMLALLEDGPADDDIQWRGIAVVDTDVSDAELERLHAAGVRGVRLNLLFRGGVDFDTVAGLAERIAPLGWHVQFLVDVSEFADLGRRLGGLPVPSVVDHLGHLPVQKGVDNAGFRDLLALVREGRTWVKLSAPYRLTALRQPPYTDVDPFAAALVEANPQRLVFGTDWPHPGVTVPMPNDGDLLSEFLRWMDGDEDLLKRVMVENAARLYGF